MVLSDKLENNPLSDVCDEFIYCPWPLPKGGIDSYGTQLWWEATPYIKTSHYLNIQWDGWVINPDAWTDEFLEYDYIGAVWPWYPDSDLMRVGNGGFSLRSTRLMKYTIDHFDEWPKFNQNDLLRFPNGIAEDAVICRLYRQKYEDLGFRWASEDLASRFSFEYCAPSPIGSFGFHDIRNFPRVLTRNEIQHRMLVADDYTKSRPGWYELGEWLAGRAIAPWEVDNEYVKARFG